jgi:hypothetical protein
MGRLNGGQVLGFFKTSKRPRPRNCTLLGMCHVDFPYREGRITFFLDLGNVFFLLNNNIFTSLIFLIIMC